MLFYNNEGVLETRKEQYFELEKSIQKITEDNLDKIFGLEFVKTEFVVRDFRIDTLAFDKDSKSFVIIEYKRSKNFAASDQCYTYIKTMRDNKAEFVLAYNEIRDYNFKRYDINWRSSKVIFISPDFTKYQRTAILYDKEARVELYEVKKYSNNLIGYNKVESETTSKVMVQQIMDKPEVKKGGDVGVYDENHHLNNASDKMKELYQKTKATILNISDDIDINYLKYTIRFLNSKSNDTIKKNINIVDLCISRRDNLFVYINMDYDSIDDPKNIIRDVSNIGHWGYGNCEIRFSTEEDIDYIKGLIKQSYDMHGN